MTTEEIKAVLSDEIYRHEKHQKKAFEFLQKLPKTREDAVTSIINELVPAWLIHDENGEKIDSADKKCQNRENAWVAASKDWMYQPPIENPTWKEKLLDIIRNLIRSADEKAWQIEGASLKEQRMKIDTTKVRLEEERQQLQAETNAKAPQIHRKADEIMAKCEALRCELNQAVATVQQIRAVCEGFPKGDEPFSISAGCDAISLVADMKLLKQIEERKDQERQKEKTRGKGQDETGGRRR